MKLAVIAAAVLLSAFRPEALPAKTLYLKNGEEMHYLSCHREGGKLYVLLNRESEIVIPAREVDFRKATARGAAGKGRRRQPHKRR